jgi:hypothetical protein
MTAATINHFVASAAAIHCYYRGCALEALSFSTRQQRLQKTIFIRKRLGPPLGTGSGNLRDLHWDHPDCIKVLSQAVDSPRHPAINLLEVIREGKAEFLSVCWFTAHR